MYFGDISRGTVAAFKYVLPGLHKYVEVWKQKVPSPPRPYPGKDLAYLTAAYLRIVSRNRLMLYVKQYTIKWYARKHASL